jgi:hypothetical protein
MQQLQQQIIIQHLHQRQSYCYTRQKQTTTNKMPPKKTVAGVYRRRPLYYVAFNTNVAKINASQKRTHAVSPHESTCGVPPSSYGRMAGRNLVVIGEME